MVDEGEAHMQACPIIGDTLAHIGLAKKRMAPPLVPNAPAAPNRTHMGETSQHVKFLTIITYDPTVPGGRRPPDAHGRGGQAGSHNREVTLTEALRLGAIDLDCA